jgi:hypothetical protein
MERTRKGLGIGFNVASVVNRLRSLALDRRDADRVAREASIGPSVKDRQLALIQFYTAYEDLVESLCDAANYGANPWLEKKYDVNRAWMIENYPNIRKYISAYLRFEGEDLILGKDAFEALFGSPNLRDFLGSDDGNMISRIMRTREALNLYGDHLRQLAAAA